MTPRFAEIGFIGQPLKVASTIRGQLGSLKPYRGAGVLSVVGENPAKLLSRFSVIKISVNS